jgi:hypothetical protein
LGRAAAYLTEHTGAPGVRYLRLYGLQEVRDGQVWVDQRLEEARPKVIPDRCFAFDQFGPLSIRPCHGTTWADRGKPDRLPATYRRTHGIRYLHGCYSIGDDTMWGVTRRRKGGGHTLAALNSIRAARPDGAPIYVILDNLSANKTPPRHNDAGRVIRPAARIWSAH